MPKVKSIFICTQCGYESPKWIGKCPHCDSWNCFEETEFFSDAEHRQTPVAKTDPMVLSQHAEKPEVRIRTGIEEFDRVLGGGIFPASVSLIAGDPGIGKSTLLLQIAGQLIRKDIPVLYLSAEESFWQIKSRSHRLGLENLPLPLLIETDLDNILYQIDQAQPQAVIIDSIQAIFSRDVSGAPGSISQVRECSSRLFRAAKEKGWSLILVGHITKEGGIAGPKILEHMVDVVIYFEGDSLNQFRILRSLKNRFGPAHEIGLFIMESGGLKEAKNPSRLFVSSESGDSPGSGIVCSFEGSRPILAEIQALVSRSNYGTPQRTVSGFDQKKLALLLAIMEKHCGLNLSFFDVFVKVAGGLKIDDPGIDLGIAAAVYSSFSDRPIHKKAVYIGELGLNGEIRSVSHLERRVEEALKLGYPLIFIPKPDTSLETFQTDNRIHTLDHISDLIQSGLKVDKTMKRKIR
jgi:DNA repair protein RadA/Sms